MRRPVFMASLALAAFIAGCAHRSTSSDRPASEPVSTHPSPAPRAAPPAAPPPDTPLPSPRLVDTSIPAEERMTWPHFGDSVHVDQPAEAVNKVPPTYPDAAREAGVQGRVWVAALVRTDGTVGATIITNGVPLLNDAAATAVSQWRFKPATVQGQPVATWVREPLNFSLH